MCNHVIHYSASYSDLHVMGAVKWRKGVSLLGQDFSDLERSLCQALCHTAMGRTHCGFALAVPGCQRAQSYAVQVSFSSLQVGSLFLPLPSWT